MTQPITPAEAAKKRGIPDFVIEVFNTLIEEAFNGRIAVVKQDIAVNRIMAHAEAQGFHRQDIFDKGWLDVEGRFCDAGWEVEYDRPGYNEPGEAVFRFSVSS